MCHCKDCKPDDLRTMPLDLQTQLAAVEAQRVMLGEEMRALDQERGRLLRRLARVPSGLHDPSRSN
jgi:hypothetical protein